MSQKFYCEHYIISCFNGQSCNVCHFPVQLTGHTPTACKYYSNRVLINFISILPDDIINIIQKYYDDLLLYCFFRISMPLKNNIIIWTDHPWSQRKRRDRRICEMRYAISTMYDESVSEKFSESEEKSFNDFFENNCKKPYQLFRFK